MEVLGDDVTGQLTVGSALDERTEVGPVVVELLPGGLLHRCVTGGTAERVLDAEADVVAPQLEELSAALLAVHRRDRLEQSDRIACEGGDTRHDSGRLHTSPPSPTA